VHASGLFLCKACKRIHHGFSYRCDKCKLCKFDVQCCLILEILKHKDHQHSLHLVIRSSETCNGCGKKGVNFRCTIFDEFTLCVRCATLPLVVRYEYHTHLLKLSYTREDDSNEEYYCLIYEEERDHPNHRFYSCVKCKFTAHFRCVLRENPCINYQRTFTDKNQEHPLTIVQKSTKHSHHYVMDVVSLLLTWPLHVLNVNLTSIIGFVCKNKLEKRERRNFCNDCILN